MKYIIKNCPAFDDQARCTAGHIITGNYLKECECFSNCLLKRIVKKCKLAKQGVGLSMKNFADELLKMLEIEEVE